MINKFGYPVKKKIQMNITVWVEFIGVASGIMGSFLVANGLFKFGYPLFLLSSQLLVYTAFKQRNINLIMMQTVFLLANINGIYTFFFKG